MTTIDTPRRYRIPNKWGWFFTLRDYEREDVCFGHDPDIRAELERLEPIVMGWTNYGDYVKAKARVRELEELLEPVA